MKLVSWKGALLVQVILLMSLIIAAFALPAKWRRASTWQQLTSPGPISASHSFLKGNCAACHTPTKGVQGVNCIVCHAGNAALLGRQPTAFHADITTCAPCHIEHKSDVLRPTKMDHSAFAQIGLSRLQPMKKSDPQSRRIRQVMNNNALLVQNPNIPAIEATLNCANCHDTKDRHRGFFGKECATCHTTNKWSIPAFLHPSPKSRDCVQCHQAPPSHYMMHFKMISMTVAKQPNAKVNDCYICHQTTVWNDIRGVGWYKHH